MSMQHGLCSTAGDSLTLNAVQIKAGLHGLLLSVTTEQHYTNQTSDNLEVVYTFPVPHNAVLLGAAIRLGDQRIEAVVFEKKQAEKAYEDAIDSGDSPMMIERAGPGLYTANLGNLKPGEQAVIEVEWAQSLTVDADVARIAIPTVIGERFGDAEFQGGLSKHQAPETDLMASYPCHFELTIAGQMAKAQVHYPSHEMQISVSQAEDGGLVKTVTFKAQAALDRDIVLLISELPQTNVAIAQEYARPAAQPAAQPLAAPETGGGHRAAVMASFTPKLPNASRQDLALKILLDCSGSMEGDSIASAKAALSHLVKSLTAEDRVSFSKFGSTVIHTRQGERGIRETTVGEFITPTPEAKQFLEKAVAATDASLGGTQLEAALLSTLRQIKPDNLHPSKSIQPAILLITDGDIWNHAACVRAARESGHRVFAIGVGSAPAESLLRNMVEDTGGTVAFVSPNENMSDAVAKMIDKMRCAQKVDLQINWGNATPIWQTDLPKTVFDQETIHIFAEFETLPTQGPTLEIATATDTQWQTAPIEVAQAAPEQIARMGAARKMQCLEPTAALAMALDYQLVSEQTNLLLVVTREEDDKAKGLPKLERIRQMAAAGHGGLGSAELILESAAPCHSLAFCLPSSARFSQGPVAMMADSIITEPSFADPQGLVIYVNSIALEVQTIEALFERVDDAWWDQASAALFEKLRDVLGKPELAFAALLIWLTDDASPGKVADLDRHAKRLARSATTLILDHELARALEQLETVS